MDLTQLSTGPTLTGAGALTASAPAASAASLNPAGTLAGDETAKRAAIAKTAQSFEASFLSTMFGEMFEGVQTEAPFGGGQGETAFRSFLTDAMGKAMTRHGGIGLSKVVAQEMLKMQGLS